MMDKSLLILDDDAPLRGRLRRAMEVRGFEVMDGMSFMLRMVMISKP